MNRGYNGQAIFEDDQDKKIFVDLIGKAQEFSWVGVLAYCIMDNHYHLIVWDVSGRLADFSKNYSGMLRH